ncbi:MAG: GGDEF domain-containing protein [Betaproteobacteria bacterium]|nr:GGDEF domain-containing protein [Betaproteobacteria bacterium]
MGDISSRLRTDDDRASLDSALGILNDCLTKGKKPVIPPALEGNGKLVALLQDIAGMHAALSALSLGDYRTPITMHGYTGGLLKTLQGNVRHMLWMFDQVAEGALSHQIDYMGDFAASFNSMTHSLREARSMLERQKTLYAELADNLSQEVEARMNAQKALRHELECQRELASTDSLTGVANRRIFLQMARHELERCRRNRTLFCLAMLDVDYFKEINDSRGHHIGDTVLRYLAKSFTQNLRSYDMIGRYGGDEFILLFPSTSLHDAARTLKRLRKSIADSDFSDCGGIPFTISAGLAAMFPHQGDISLQDAIAKADKALYLSKQRGRNRVTVLPDEEL